MGWIRRGGNLQEVKNAHRPLQEAEHALFHPHAPTRFQDHDPALGILRSARPFPRRICWRRMVTQTCCTGVREAAKIRSLRQIKTRVHAVGASPENAGRPQDVHVMSPLPPGRKNLLHQSMMESLNPRDAIPRRERMSRGLKVRLQSKDHPILIPRSILHLLGINPQAIIRPREQALIKGGSINFILPGILLPKRRIVIM